MSANEPLTLFALHGLLKQTLESHLSGTYWIQTELSDVRTHAAGHCYLEFVQKDTRTDQLVAKARGMIWNHVWRLLKPYFEETTGRTLSAGLKVLVEVRVRFHELYGYSLEVQNIDPTYTVGDLARRRREILMQLEKEGVLTMNKELKFPILPQRVAVISSPTAAGYGDFCHQLKNHRLGESFHVELFTAMMQGSQVESSILTALDAIHARCEEFDVVVIIRGGGATSDLSGFDTYMLAASCAQFPLPIITGIGHERDETVLDSVAHTRVKTPTAAAALLIQCLEAAEQTIDRLATRLQESVKNRVQYEWQRLGSYALRLPSKVTRSLSAARQRLSIYEGRLLPAVRSSLLCQKHKLELLEQRIDLASPQRLLERGYSLTVYKGKVLTDTTVLQPGDDVKVYISKGAFNAKVMTLDASDKPFAGGKSSKE